MNEERYLLFDQYLNNEMVEEDKIDFEKQMSQQTELASEFQIFKEFNGFLDNKYSHEKELIAFKKNLNSIANEHFNRQKPKVVTFKSWHYAIAASIVVIFGLFLFDQNQIPSYEDYNEHENAYFIERGEDNEALKLAQEAFNLKDYKKATFIFKTILKENPSVEIKFFYGISLLENNQFQMAEVIFNEIKTSNSVYKNKAVWLLALSKLKQKQYLSCKNILLTIPSDYENYQDVQKLIKALD